MRTLRPKASAPASACLAPVRDAAPSLVPVCRLGRANGVLPAPAFAADAVDLETHEQAVIDAAFAILRARLRRPGACVKSSSAARDALRLHLANRDRECFAVLFLNAQNAVITYEEMFLGTLTQTSVYPREIVRAALRHNAAAVILAHNHPSGVSEPSEADKVLTEAIRRALALVDVRTLDHFVIGGDSVMSFAERGLM